MSATPAGNLPVRFGPDGLIPAVIQDAATDRVLMVGFMNVEALAATRETGRVHFWSRSRQKLWRKGESSGHVQIVEDLFINCEQNSLLVTVRQIGAVCHDGYDTCFYRRLEPDYELKITRERVFDPVDVYGVPGADLATLSRTHYAAFAFLRDHDLTTQSRTSALLRDATAGFHARIADETRELAGVLDGSHRHNDLRSDVLLEGTQVLYWVTLAALRAGVDWTGLRPDRALATSDPTVSPATVSRLLRKVAATWDNTPENSDAVARLQETLALAGQAAHLAGITPAQLITSDLDAALAKPYMAGFAVPPAANQAG